tara:strand:+ start:723 stop:830 length:108 start_codon:yes stop_codon:yes gene_type:complete
MNDNETTKFATFFLVGIALLVALLGVGAYFYSIYM